MDEGAAFTAPIILHVLCYFGGMAVFLSTIFWLARKAYGYPVIYSLREIVGIWFLRMLTGCALFSLGYMVLIGAQEAYILPELSILFLVFALYLLSVKERPMNWRRVFMADLPREVLKIIYVFLFCVMAWVISLVFGWLVFNGINFLGGPLWLPIFMIGVVWNVPPLLLYLRASASSRLDGLKFHQILWPILLAYILLMFPEITEHVANNPKVHEILNPGTPIVRV